VHTSHGDVAIENIHEGDSVVSRNAVTGKLEPEPVTALTPLHQSSLLEVRIEGQQAPLRPSINHPFWVKRGNALDGSWLRADKMHVGDFVQSVQGAWRRVVAITPLPGQETVYNFTVAKDHDYFVGETGFLVHNANCGCGPLDDLPRYLQYWEDLQGRAPDRSIPYDLIHRYDGDGNIIGATSYDGFGNRATQYELPDNTRHGPGFHDYDNGGRNGGFGKGERSDHCEFGAR
jgi:hypothetical protein